MRKFIVVGFFTSSFIASSLFAQSFSFSTGDPDGLLATASRPESSGKFEIESADDFILSSATQLTSGSFTGLLPVGVAASDIQSVTIEIYRVFPTDSDVGRTSGAPLFSTTQVPTQVNSPSDVAFTTRDSSASGGLTFTTSVLNSSFTALNSITPGGIHPTPGNLTGGNGAVTGQEVQFLIDFVAPLDLAADHYFFIPQVELTTGDFLWLSAPKPIVPPGTPFVPDLQAWTRDANLDPDWLRDGTDIIGGTAFNQVFSLTGVTTPENGSTIVLLGVALAGLVLLKRREQICNRAH